MPTDLKDHIGGQNDPLKRNTIWVSCQGENPADEENIGPIEYYPGMGFPGYFYPYENSEGYLSPLVAVQFKKLHREYQAETVDSTSPWDLMGHIISFYGFR